MIVPKETIEKMIDQADDRAEYYHIYMDYKNELADLDADIGNLTEEGHW